MKLEAGILNLDGLKRFGAALRGKLDHAEFRAVETLKAIAGKKMVEILTTDLHSRTGNLKKSAAASIATAKPQREGLGWAVRIGYGEGPSAKYARIQEEGGTVRPVSAKVLAIPIGEALTATGRPRYASPRDVAGGRWFTSKAGNIVFARPGEAPLFVGKTQVTLTGKHAAERARAEAQSRARTVFEAEIARAVA